MASVVTLSERHNIHLVSNIHSNTMYWAYLFPLDSLLVCYSCYDSYVMT